LNPSTNTAATRNQRNQSTGEMVPLVVTALLRPFHGWNCNFIKSDATVFQLTQTENRVKQATRSNAFLNKRFRPQEFARKSRSQMIQWIIIKLLPVPEVT